MSIQSKQAFMRWVKVRHPGVYSRAMGIATGQNLGALTQADQMAQENAYVMGAPANSSQVQWYEKALDSAIKTVSDLMPTYAAAEQAKMVLKVNIERAKQGLPPIDATSLSPQVNVGIPRDVQYILWAALAIGGIFVVSKIRG